MRTAISGGRRGRLTSRWGVSLAAIAVLGVTACGSGGGSSSNGSGSGPITIGELFPFTGNKSQLSDWGVHGTKAAVDYINAHGGVLGRQLKTASADDAGDAVDVVPAFRKLLLNNPVAVIGPFSPTIEPVIGQFGPNHVVDFMIGGTAQLDKMQYPNVFRTSASDTTEAVAMAYYANQKGYKKAAFLFDNSANAQGFVPPLKASFEKLGGTVTKNLSLVPDQSSYRSELLQAFADNPDVVFCSFDDQTATTLWSDARQLGHLNVPWIGDDLLASAVYDKAFGAEASQYLFSVSGAPPGGDAFKHYLDTYQAAWGTKKILPSTFNMYDAVMIASLAMTKAKSTDPTVWAKDVTQVANPPGTSCFDYPVCVKDIQAGMKINYQGAGGPDDFNQYHNVFNGYAVSGFTADAQLNQVGYVSADQVAANAG